MRVRTSVAASGMKPLELGVRVGIRNGRCIVFSPDVVFFVVALLTWRSTTEVYAASPSIGKALKNFLNGERAPAGLERRRSATGSSAKAIGASGSDAQTPEQQTPEQQIPEQKERTVRMAVVGKNGPDHAKVANLMDGFYNWNG
jgi:hypothetical protein